MKPFNIVLTFATCFFFLTCRDKGIEPDNTPKPGKRNYVWTIDTISYPGSLQTDLRTIWGSTPKDVYAGGFNERGYGELYHYNGTRWEVVIHGYRAIDIRQIYGFSSNDVWLAGAYGYRNPDPPPFFLDSSVILHYDGMRWNEVPLERGRQLQGIWGTGPRSMFSAGTFGTLFRYDGNRWTRMSADTTIWYSRMGGTAHEIYLLGYIPNSYSPDQITHEYLMNWKDSTFVLVDSMMLVPGYTPRFGANNVMAVGNTIYSVGSGIFRKSETGWERIISVGVSFGGIYGTRAEHIFFCGTSKTIYHFNGIDWKKLDIPGNPLLPLAAVWCTEEEVFVLGSDGSRSYVIHGK